MDFKRTVEYMFNHPDQAQLMGENAYKVLLDNYSPETHYERLMNLFEGVLKA